MATSAPHALPRGPRRHPLLLLLMALAGLTLAAYAPVLGGGYEFLNIDDDEYVTDNPHVQAGLTGPSLWWALTSFHANNWHPLTWVSLQLDRSLFGPEPWGFHATNLLLHTANVLLLFWALHRLTGSTWRSACVAAFFAVHPLHVESVAWVAERKDVLSTLFWMLTLLAYTHYVSRPCLRRYLLVVLALGLGLMAKPMLVTLPCVLLLLDYWPLRRLRLGPQEAAVEGASLAAPPHPQPLSPEGRGVGGEGDAPLGRLVAEKLPLFALVLACALLTFLAQARTRHSLSLPLAVRGSNAVVSYVAYATQMVWPHDLAAFYPHPRAGRPAAEVAGAAGLLTLVTALAWWQCRRRPYLAVGWLWYLGTLVPVIGLVQVGHQARADRYTYVPLIGLFLLLAWGVRDLLARWRCPRLAAGLAVTGLLTACLVVTWHQLSWWRDSLVLWQHTEAVTPENPFPHLGQAMALEKQGCDAEAEEQYRLAVGMDTVPPQFHAVYGLFLWKRKRLREAQEQFQITIQGDPYNPVANLCLGALFQDKGRPEDARRHYIMVLRAEPDNPEAHYNLGLIFERQGKLNEAYRHFNAAAKSRPDDAEAHAHLGLVSLLQGHLTLARQELNRARELNPRLADVYLNLGAVSWNEGKREEARHDFLRALEVNSRHAGAHHNLGMVCLAEGKLEEARRYFLRALELDPQHAGAHEHLGVVCERKGQTDEARRHFAEAARLREQFRQPQPQATSPPDW